MKNELLLFIEKHTDTMIEQTKTKPQETFEFEMKKHRETFSFSPPINLAEEGKRSLTVTSFTTTNSVWNINLKNTIFSVSTPSCWTLEDGEELINKLNKFLELRSENDIELHLKLTKVNYI